MEPEPDLDAHMELEDEIRARVERSRIKDHDQSLTAHDFQVKVTGSGSVLINLKTRRAYLLFDDSSAIDEEADDFADLTPSDEVRTLEDLDPEDVT